MVSVTDSPAPSGPDIDAWVDHVSRERSADERAVIAKAADLAQRAHAGQSRASGEPYVQHVLAVADILDNMRMDYETIAAALLHDVVEDTHIELEDIRREFGADVARMVDGVTKMGRIGRFHGDKPQPQENDQHHAESVRKLLLAMVEDVRVVLIKLADRLHNMRTLSFLSPDRQRRIAQETLDIYAALANRLGIWQIKWELEDLSLRYLEGESYRKIASLLDERRVDRQRYIDGVVDELNARLAAVGVEAEVTGRPKHIYSIWRKMNRKNVDFHQIFDVRAVRVLVEKEADCYAALGVVHGIWHHIPREFDDYIANPKENLYRSLHTAVVGPDGRTLEVQIRTHEMHHHSELGVAAHWRYKEGTRADQRFEEKIVWMRQLLEWRDEEASATDFVDRFKSETAEDRVYVLTPQGKVVDMPQGATPLDFAYYIHTELGHRCRGAKVNGRIVPLTYELHSGEQVEVLSTRQGTPSRDWLSPHLGYLKTSRARAKVRAWFRQQDLQKNVAAGRAALERELHRLGIGKLNWETLAHQFHFKETEELLEAIGKGDVGTSQIATAAHGMVAPAAPEPQLRPVPRRPAGERAADSSVRVEGVGNLLTNMAQCCRPVPPDPIVGYITRGRGVTIHRCDCANALRLRADHQERLIEVSWGEHETATYPVEVSVLAYDRPGLLRDITSVLANEGANVIGMQTRTDLDDHAARMSLTLEIRDISQLSRVLGRIGQLPNVVEARRKV